MKSINIGPHGLQQMSHQQMLNALTNHSLDIRRQLLSRHLREKFNGVVAYGHLKGFDINQPRTWGQSADLGAQLIGFYEKEVLDAVFERGHSYELLVNIGAGDGYYGVGLLKQDVVKRSICFEVNSRSRDTLAACAKVNGVADRISISGIAERDFLDSGALSAISLAGSLFIVDIEGGEFQLFDNPVLQRLRQSELIIELHGGFFPGNPEMETEFLSRLGEFFDCRILTTGPRNPSSIPELSPFCDTDRWLICSEGRPYTMKWVHCSPRE